MFSSQLSHLPLSKCHWHFFFPGGGTALIRAAQKLEGVKPECYGCEHRRIKSNEASNEDEKLGIEIIRRAVEEPLRMIVENAGLEGSVIVNEVKNGKGDYGYNARTEKYEPLFESGVIDPANERESGGLSPRGPGVVCRRLGRQRRQHRRHAPHHRVRPLRHQGTRAMASAQPTTPDARRLVCPATEVERTPAWAAWAVCTKPQGLVQTPPLGGRNVLSRRVLAESNKRGSIHTGAPFIRLYYNLKCFQ